LKHFVVNQTNSNNMKKVRLLILWLLVAFVPLSIYADEESLTIMVKGTPVTILLSEHPIITYANDALQITTSEKKIEIPVKDIESFSFDDSVNDIRAIRAIKNGQVEMYGNIIYFKMLKPESKVDVYSVDGRLVNESFVDSDGNGVADLSKLSKGVYVIKTYLHVIKITNK